jgi:hypothetical protein
MKSSSSRFFPWIPSQPQNAYEPTARPTRQRTLARLGFAHPVAGPRALVRPSRGHPRRRTQMLQELPGVGPGRHCRLRHSLSSPLCRPAHRSRAPVSRRDSLAVVRRRLEGICSAAGVDFQSLPVEVIATPAAAPGCTNGPRAPHQYRPGTPTALAHSRSSDPVASRRRERRLIGS